MFFVPTGTYAGWLVSAVLWLFPVPVNAQSFSASIANWFTNHQSTMSGLHVMTKQTAVSAQQIATADQLSMKALASSIVATEAQFDLVKANRSAVSTLAQGGDLCRSVDIGLSAASAETVADVVRTGVSDFETAWRTTGGDEADLLEGQIEMRQDVFCTEAEFQAGLCTDQPSSPNGLTSAEFPAADSNAAPFMLRRSYGSTTAMNGVNYIDTIAPMTSIDPTDTSVIGSIERIAAVHELALKSVARGVVADVVGRGTEGQ